MKQVTEMSWEELLKLREQVKTELGEAQDDDDDQDVSEDNDDLVKSYDSDTHEWIEADLIDALAALHEVKEAAPSVKKGAPKSPPKGYPSDKSKYADPTNFKYPLDTEAHVRAALSYFSKSANRSKGGYSPQEQKFMWKRIIGAAKKYGIELSDDVKKHAEAVGDSNSGGGEVIKMEMKEQELRDLISGIFDARMKEQSIQNPGGTLGQGQKGSGGMESYQPQVRVPPDIEAINTQLDGFKQMHAKHEAANKDMSAKLEALQKQVSAMNEAFTKMQQDAQDGDDDDSDDSNGKSTENKAAQSSKATRGEPDKDDEDEDGDDGEDDDSDVDDDADSQEEKVRSAKQKQKVKEQQQHAHAEGLVATSDMTEGTGVTPPGFAVEDPDSAPRSFGDVMNRATRQRRRGIGVN